ncbi:TPA: transporter substrate-binding domain-containing protein [Pseudomonas putida]|uniref:transporter substrate-binding domain-containing protein n=1 Tax=Pseudomonas TaxID=286 RepID=UPI00110C91C9|nr:MULTISPECIES: transporter substrate-binding domain-containing protein [Pseudomonas]MDD1992935.1 transporter substrate-binding domain-containing protein [Pseudomonas putida]HDS0916747.1 transporter substrate-binding domain-containing protein [Pseudomonas putida]HDS0931506.1 transporter substrate-binding domain-containing protein [Pseudomonas putida]HDS1782873.1 transporter substrate-binding domain-containing protein [Pseudomonas putida]HDS3796782.1 transporter substrate-binding domain-contai
MTTITPAVLDDLAPGGVMHAAINFGNPVLAQRGPNGEPQGVSVALAKALAQELGVKLEMRTFDAAGKVFAALDEGVWSLAFLAIEPVREAQISFSEPYVIIEGTYLVERDSPFQSVVDLDQAGLKLAVGKGAAYDLFLTRTLKNAELERADTSAGAVDLFLEQKLDAAAGVRQPLQKVADLDPRYRVLDDAFTSIRQAMAVPRGRDAGAAYVRAFVERKKAEGFIHAALAQSGQADVTVAP